MRSVKFLMIALPMLALFSCGIPAEKLTRAIPRIEGVDIQRYLGTWYEIVRMPAPFEDGLDKTTATYSLRPDGKIDVLNAGYRNGKYETAHGTAWVPDPAKPTELKVSFFFLVASGYYIIALDQANYQYAMITSDSKDYLWILSRTPKMDAAVYQKLLDQAKNWGFDLGRLVVVKQD